MSLTSNDAQFGGRHPMPRLTASTFWTILLAGSVATVAFDFFGQVLSPVLGFSKLAPVPLANSVLKAVTGSGHLPSAHLMHFVTGLIGYPLGWLLVARPLAGLVAPRIPWLFVSVAYGIGLWVFGLYIMAHLVAGLAPFLNFTQIAWVALVGHIVYGVVMAAVVAWRENADG